MVPNFEHLAFTAKTNVFQKIFKQFKKKLLWQRLRLKRKKEVGYGC